MKTIVFGYGAMGKLISDVIQEKPDLQLVAAVEPRAQQDKPPVVQSLKSITEKADILIDFSHPNNINIVLDYCIAERLPVVICTTGFDEVALLNIRAASKQIPVLLASNTSLGVNLLHQLIKIATQALSADFDIEIIEKHHNKKVDAPSGTANSLLQTIQANLPESKRVVYGRKGMEKRQSEDIGMHSLRGGTIVGEHTIIFAGEDEIIELTHSAQSKKIFAQGAIRAARFLVRQEVGFYEMGDVL